MKKKKDDDRIIISLYELKNLKKDDNRMIISLYEFKDLIQLTAFEYQLKLRKTQHESYYQFPVSEYEYSCYFNGKNPTKTKERCVILVINLETGRPFKIFRQPDYRFEWIRREKRYDLKIYIPIMGG